MTMLFALVFVPLLLTMLTLCKRKRPSRESSTQRRRDVDASKKESSDSIQMEATQPNTPELSGLSEWETVDVTQNDPIVSPPKATTVLDKTQEGSMKKDRPITVTKTQKTTEQPDLVEPPSKKKKKRIDFTRFCKEFKNRYLFVCPDPFRFGQKAVVFCPIYSERCHVPLPDRPVVPTRRPPRGHRASTVEKLCRSYRAFADTYCSNPILLSQQQYREGCERYWRFCTRRTG